MTIDERVQAAQSLAPGFGDGWASKAAVDMMRIGGFAGFDVHELAKRVAVESNPNRSVNTASVERVMAEMLEEFDAAKAQVPA